MYLSKQCGGGLQGGKMRWLRIKWCKPEDETCNALLGEQRETDIRSKIRGQSRPEPGTLNTRGRLCMQRLCHDLRSHYAIAFRETQWSSFYIHRRPRVPCCGISYLCILQRETCSPGQLHRDQSIEGASINSINHHDADIKDGHDTGKTPS